jgi:cytoskeletal protein RodZ
MKTVGELLKTARVEKALTLEQISSFTKINIKYLNAIEQNEFHKLPPSAFTKGFLHTYASIVEINPDTVLAIFRRDYDQDDRGRIVPRSLTDPIKAASIGITPSMLTIGISVSIGIIMVGFFVRQILLFSSTPKLSVIEPTENAQLISPVNIRGVTDPQTIVEINNNPLVVDPNGEFSTQMQFSPGQHTLVVIAVGRTGKKTTVERVIYIQMSP